MPFERWMQIGRRVSMYSDASQWWLGDWLVFGEDMYGRRYKQAVGLTGLEYQTLRNYAMVARRFPLARRRAGLSFHHHAEVCPLPDEEQEYWLNRAQAEAWSRNTLRRHLRARRAPVHTETRALHLAVTSQRIERWVQAARRSDNALEGWILDTLDGAADEQLAAAPQIGELAADSD
jgi:hypothetical protein